MLDISIARVIPSVLHFRCFFDGREVGDGKNNGKTAAAVDSPPYEKKRSNSQIFPFLFIGKGKEIRSTDMDREGSKSCSSTSKIGV